MAFADDMSQFVSKTKAKLRLFNHELILTVAGSLIEKSPVGDPVLWESKRAPKGYVPGTFKANWNGAFGHIDDSITDETDPTGELSLVRINEAIPDDPTGVFYITNSLPYAIPLEDGHSTQAPQGMVGITVLEFDQIFAASLVKAKAL
jgi:hypothetical protein